MKSNEKLHIDEYYLQETNGWLRELDFFLSELSFLKTRLAHIVDSANDKELVATAEKFQSDFLNHDEQIKQIRVEVITHENNLQRKHAESLLKNKTASSVKQGTVRKQVAAVELDFIQLKNSFNSFALNSIKSI